MSIEFKISSGQNPNGFVSNESSTFNEEPSKKQMDQYIPGDGRSKLLLLADASNPRSLFEHIQLATAIDGIEPAGKEIRQDIRLNFKNSDGNIRTALYSGKYKLSSNGKLTLDYKKHKGSEGVSWVPEKLKGTIRLKKDDRGKFNLREITFRKEVSEDGNIQYKFDGTEAASYMPPKRTRQTLCQPVAVAMPAEKKAPTTGPRRSEPDKASIDPLKFSKTTALLKLLAGMGHSEATSAREYASSASQRGSDDFIVKKIKEDIIFAKHPKTYGLLDQLAKTNHPDVKYAEEYAISASQRRSDDFIVKKIKEGIIFAKHPKTYGLLDHLAKTNHPDVKSAEEYAISASQRRTDDFIVKKIKEGIIFAKHPKTYGLLDHLAKTNHPDAKYAEEYAISASQRRTDDFVVKKINEICKPVKAVKTVKVVETPGEKAKPAVIKAERPPTADPLAKLSTQLIATQKNTNKLIKQMNRKNAPKQLKLIDVRLSLFSKGLKGFFVKFPDRNLFKKYCDKKEVLQNKRSELIQRFKIKTAKKDILSEIGELEGSIKKLLENIEKPIAAADTDATLVELSRELDGLSKRCTALSEKVDEIDDAKDDPCIDNARLSARYKELQKSIDWASIKIDHKQLVSLNERIKEMITSKESDESKREIMLRITRLGRQLSEKCSGTGKKVGFRDKYKLNIENKSDAIYFKLFRDLKEGKDSLISSIQTNRLQLVMTLSKESLRESVLKEINDIRGKKGLAYSGSTATLRNKKMELQNAIRALNDDLSAIEKLFKKFVPTEENFENLNERIKKNISKAETMGADVHVDADGKTILGTIKTKLETIKYLTLVEMALKKANDLIFREHKYTDADAQIKTAKEGLGKAMQKAAGYVRSYKKDYDGKINTLMKEGVKGQFAEVTGFFSEAQKAFKVLEKLISKPVEKELEPLSKVLSEENFKGAYAKIKALEPSKYIDQKRLKGIKAEFGAIYYLTPVAMALIKGGSYKNINDQIKAAKEALTEAKAKANISTLRERPYKNAIAKLEKKAVKAANEERAKITQGELKAASDLEKTINGLIEEAVRLIRVKKISPTNIAKDTVEQWKKIDEVITKLNDLGTEIARLNNLDTKINQTIVDKFIAKKIKLATKKYDLIKKLRAKLVVPLEKANALADMWFKKGGFQKVQDITNQVLELYNKLKDNKDAVLAVEVKDKFGRLLAVAHRMIELSRDMEEAFNNKALQSVQEIHETWKAAAKEHYPDFETFPVAIRMQKRINKLTDKKVPEAVEKSAPKLIATTKSLRNKLLKLTRKRKGIAFKIVPFRKEGKTGILPFANIYCPSDQLKTLLESFSKKNVAKIAIWYQGAGTEPPLGKTTNTQFNGLDIDIFKVKRDDMPFGMYYVAIVPAGPFKEMGTWPSDILKYLRDDKQSNAVKFAKELFNKMRQQPRAYGIKSLSLAYGLKEAKKPPKLMANPNVFSFKIKYASYPPYPDDLPSIHAKAAEFIRLYKLSGRGVNKVVVMNYIRKGSVARRISDVADSFKNAGLAVETYEVAYDPKKITTKKIDLCEEIILIYDDTSIKTVVDAYHALVKK